MSSIFERQHDVRPSQLAAVADRRFDDARTLCDTNDNARANGTQYLAGIVLDILLKAQLIVKHRQIARKRSHELKDAERRVWSLIWRSHDLGGMLSELRGVSAAVEKQGKRAGKPYLEWLQGICAAWTVYARYSTKSATIEEAREMLERVRQLKEILK